MTKYIIQIFINKHIDLHNYSITLNHYYLGIQMKPRKDEINSQNSDIEIISQAKSSIIIDELPSNSRHHINTKIC